MQQPTIRYKRSRFTTRLPVERLYTPSHYWLTEEEPGLWRVGFTQFATRMLGDMVEIFWVVQPENPVTNGQVIGTVEGMKAVAEIYCAVNGTFMGINPMLQTDITLVDTDPYGEGWLYRVRGTPEPLAVNVHGYISTLDQIIDKLLANRHTSGECDEFNTLS